MPTLRDKKAIVTGASSGIGQAVAIAFAEAGADVVITYHENPAGAETTRRAIEGFGQKCLIFQIDFKSSAALNTFLNEAMDFLGGLDIFVNNAGTLSRHLDFLEIPLEEFDQIQAINLRAPFILIQAAARKMKTQSTGGSIINISSMSAEIITPGLTHYECSKVALNALTKSAASALAQYNIRVNAILPGLVETKINEHQRQNDIDAWNLKASRIPLGRAGKPSDVASMAILLAADESSWTTGALIPVDGGIGVSSPFRAAKK